MSVNVSTSSVDRSHMNFGRVKQQGSKKEKKRKSKKKDKMMRDESDKGGDGEELALTFALSIV